MLTHTENWVNLNGMVSPEAINLTLSFKFNFMLQCKITFVQEKRQNYLEYSSQNF